MAKAKNKDIVSNYASKVTNPRDLSDEKKAEILGKEFSLFQESMAKKLGLQIGVRLQEIKNETTYGHQAIMVPVKLVPTKEYDNKETPHEKATA